MRSWLKLAGFTFGHLSEIPTPLQLLPELIRRAELGGVGGIVASELQRLGVAEDWLQTKDVSWISGAAQHLARLDQLAQKFSERGIEVVGLKGAALSPTVYLGQMSCRPFSDLDLLVKPYDRESAWIAGTGFAGPPYVALDWHNDLVNARRFPSRGRLCQIDLEEVWKRSYLWKSGIRFLEPELQFVQLSLHAAKHSYGRMIWLVDLALVQRACALAPLLRLARALGAERPVALALRLVEDFFPGSLKSGSKTTRRASLAREVRPRLRWYEMTFAWLARYPDANLAWGEFFLILSVDGMSHKLDYLFEFLFPRGHAANSSGVLRRFWRFLTNPGRTSGNQS